MSRSWLIGVSVLTHVAVGVGLFASGVWKIERVEARAMPTFLSVTPPPPPPASGQLAGAVKPPDKPPVIKKKPPEVLVQPDDKKPKEETPGTTTGTVPIPGPIDGPPSDSPCLENCGPPAPAAHVDPVCGNHTLEVGEQCDDGNLADGDGCSRACRTEPRKPATVAMSVLAGLRTSGETQIQPSSSTQSQMVRDGVDEVSGRVTVCISTTGAVAASLSGSTKYPDYDRALLSAVQTWHYRPYSVNGVAVPACSMVQFHYRMR